MYRVSSTEFEIDLGYQKKKKSALELFFISFLASQLK
jgi:hypothetical protein